MDENEDAISKKFDKISEDSKDLPCVSTDNTSRLQNSSVRIKQNIKKRRKNNRIKIIKVAQFSS